MASAAELKEQMIAELKAARDIAEKYTGDIPADELAIVSGHMKRYEALKQQFDSQPKTGGGFFAGPGLEELQGVLGGVPGVPALNAPAGKGYRSKAADRWGARVREVIEKRAGAAGAKALIGGSIDIPSVVSEPVTISGRPTALLELIPRRPAQRTSDPNRNVGNAFSYLVQTARTLNAGGVPDNAEKPVSVATFDDREDRYRVYATVSEALPRRFLDDYAQIIAILQRQLGEGLLESLERDILNGTGTPTATTDPVKGILQTSGILVQAYATSVLQTLSNARYTLTDTNVTPTAWVMNSRDVQALELMRENGTTGPLMFGSGRSDIEAILGGYPIVTSSLMTLGSALLGDFNQAELIVREDDHLDVDGSGALFTKNQVIFRHEGRYGFAVNKPSAFITVDLTP